MMSATNYLSRASRVLAGVLLVSVFAVTSAFGQFTMSGNGLPILTNNALSTANGSDFGGLLAQVETQTNSFMITNGATSTAVCDISFDGAGDTTEGDFTLTYSGAAPTIASPAILHPTMTLSFFVEFVPLDADVNAPATDISIDYDNVAPLDCAAIVGTFDLNLDGQGLLDFGDSRSAGPDYSAETNFAGLGARHVASGVTLGSRRDAEADAVQAAGDYDGDDDDAVLDDEDGLVSVSSLLTGLGGSIAVDVDGAGYLNVFIDGANDGSYATAGDLVVDDLAVVDGQNIVAFTVPVGAGATGMRLRICSAADTCDSAAGLATDGEVEDYEVTLLVATAASTIELGGTEANIALVGLNTVVTDENGVVLFSGPQASIGAMTITGDITAETVTVHPDAVPVAGLTVDLGAGPDDSLVLSASTATAVTHVFDNLNDGTVYVDAATIVYTGLDPIIDNVDAANRTFTFSDGSETITMTPGGDGASGNGITHIDSDLAEMVSFVNPTASLTINTDNGGAGADVVVIGELDTPLAGTFASLTVNSGGGADSVTIAPSADYVITADGGLGTDVFILDLSNGASVDVFNCVANSVSFTSGENTILFPNFEGCGPSDLELTLNKSIIYAGDNLAGNTVLTITVTNNGPAPAVGAVVDLGDLLTDNGVNLVASAALALPPLAVGASTTIDITGFVINHNPATYDITVNLLGDTNTTNNTAVLTSEPGFAFPPKVQINAATYVTQETTINGIPSAPYDKLVVGLFQGAPGIQGAVWCKIPNPITIVGPSDPVLENEVLFPTPLIGGAVPYSDYFGDRWRPCAKGLPFPLHVNDIFEDDNDTPADFTDDTLWLMTWGSAGLYRSDDKGESWTAAAPDATCTSVPTDCLANGNGGNGAWTNVYAMTRGIDGFLYISVNDGYVFRSLNDGVSWQQVGSLPEVDADTPWSLVADPDDAGTIYAGTFGRGVYVSTNWGFTWDFLGGSGENDVLLNNPLADLDNPDDLFAGHIFDLEVGENTASDIMLFAGTGNGIWRYNTDLVPTAGALGEGWEFFGPTVTQGIADYVPEIRSMAMGPDDDATLGPDFLIGGSWGFGGFMLLDPANVGASPTATAPYVLRGANVTLVAVAPTTGQAFFGTDTGENITINVMASTSTANEDEITSVIPEGYALGQNYPNPFNPVTTIQFALPESGNVRLAVYDILGREVAVLVDKAMTAGQHDVQFNAQSLTSGTYIYRLTTDKGSFTKQLSLLK